MSRWLRYYLDNPLEWGMARAKYFGNEGCFRGTEYLSSPWVCGSTKFGKTANGRPAVLPPSLRLTDSSFLDAPGTETVRCIGVVDSCARYNTCYLPKGNAGAELWRPRHGWFVASGYLEGMLTHSACGSLATGLPRASSGARQRVGGIEGTRAVATEAL